MTNGAGAYAEIEGGEVTDAAWDHTRPEGDSSVVEDAEDKAGSPEPMEVVVADHRGAASDGT
eukprot:2653-Eustigmatos_ZCMA.PRE.1